MINSSNNENNNPNVASNNGTSDPNNNRNADPRGFPSPFSTGRFAFDDSDDDMFGDIDLRSRLHRMGDPFDWAAHKRRGSGGYTDPTAAPAQAPSAAAAGTPSAHQYFHDDFDFPGFGGPQFDVFNRARKRTQRPDIAHDRHKNFYDYVPAEFRQYFPESFGMFPSMRQQQHQVPTGVGSGASIPMTKTPPLSPQQRHAQSPLQQQQQQFIYQEPPRPKLCDAAIQTETPDVTDGPREGSNNLNQHGLRNTVDLGQKSASEEMRQDRAQSAPPPVEHNQQQSVSASGPFVSATTAAGAFSNAGTSMTPQAGAKPQFYYPNQSIPQQQQQAQIPPQPQQQQQQPRPQQQQPQQYAQPPRPQQQSSQFQPDSTPGGTFIRTVPIFVEGCKIPVVPKPNASGPNIAQATTQQEQSQQSPPQQRTQSRPEPFNVTNQPQHPPAAASGDASQIPPQTPHTTDCINKIQDIQRDVLELMGAVDRFCGTRGDRQYRYIDEMLTRNLLKLDTIDTNGKDSIRLARKEAIRCIQASIAVLEAKAEQNSQPKEQNSTKEVANKEEGNIEQSLEEKLQKFEGKDSVVEENVNAAEIAVPSARDEVIEAAVGEEENKSTGKHVSEVKIQLNIQPQSLAEPKEGSFSENTKTEADRIIDDGQPQLEATPNLN